VRPERISLPMMSTAAVTILSAADGASVMPKAPGWWRRVPR
jgi:hypothetical protein